MTDELTYSFKRLRKECLNIEETLPFKEGEFVDFLRKNLNPDEYKAFLKERYHARDATILASRFNELLDAFKGDGKKYVCYISVYPIGTKVHLYKYNKTKGGKLVGQGSFYVLSSDEESVKVSVVDPFHDFLQEHEINFRKSGKYINFSYVNDFVNSYSDLANKSLEVFDTNIKTFQNNAEKKVEEFLDKANNDFKNSLNTFNTNIETKEKETKNEMNKKVDQLNSDYDNNKDKMNKKVDQLNSEYDVKKKLLDDKFAALELKFKEFRAGFDKEITDNAKTYKGELSRIYKGAETKLNADIKAVDDQWSSLSQHVQILENKVQDRLRTLSDSIKKLDNQ